MAPRSTRAAKPDVITMEFTIHMAKHMHKIGFKKRAPRAVRAIKKFVTVNMGTKDVRIDSKLNQFVWSRGIRGVPDRVRIRCERKRNEDEDAKEKLYTYVTHVDVASFRDLVPEVISA